MYVSNLKKYLKISIPMPITSLKKMKQKEKFQNKSGDSPQITLENSTMPNWYPEHSRKHRDIT